MKEKLSGFVLSVALFIGGPAAGIEFQWEYLDSPTTLPINDVFFTDSMNGWCAGDQGILRTVDGGDNWTMFFTNDDAEATHFINEDEGWVCGNDGMLLHTTNGGDNWTPLNSGVAEKLRDIRMADNLSGWTVGRDGILRHTTDGGISWNHQTNPAVDDLYAIAIYNPSTAWIVGKDGMILFTSNGGNSWASQPSGTFETHRGVFFIDSQTGWVCGDQGIILKTNNGGTSWTLQNTPTVTILRDIYFVDSNNGWVVGDGGAVLSTSDGGNTWVDADAGIFSSLNSVHFVNSELGFTVGMNGIIVRYSQIQTGIDDDIVEKPKRFNLKKNYPNPFNATTIIPVEVEEKTFVKLEIFDINGRLIESLYNGVIDAGNHLIAWNAAGNSSGIYYYSLSSNAGVSSKKMLLIK